MFLNRKIKVIGFLLIIIIASIVVFNHVLYKDHDKIENLESHYVGNCSDFLSEDQETFNDKIVDLKGVLTKIENSSLVLNEQIFVLLDSTQKTENLKLNQNLRIKGRVVGFDEILEETKIDKAILLK
ncbi:hypothetical protein [Aureivirga sp. CE67]|uniref:hypothetical protein n=1 Tax=Aureivirga sp. CE67 TaxID=1788983 RepID=UPI0018CB8CD6|nr:hypothetical protein [Aureivirga sp. CE67]